MSIMYKAFIYRLYPTAKQTSFFIKTFGCCRKVYNLMLADKIAYYEKTGSMLAVTPAKYKKDYPFLKEVDSLALANEQLHLQKAYKNFFRDPKIGFPKFKSDKRCRKSYTTNNQRGTIAITNNSIRLPKIGYIKARIHRYPPTNWQIKSATVFQETDGKFYVSILCKYQAVIPPAPVTKDVTLGLDYKSNGLYADSNGDICGMPHYYKESAKRLAKAQRKLQHKCPGSRNYYKQQKKIAKICRHVASQRMDFLHKKSAAIAKQYSYICVESLNMKSLANKSFHNGKATLNNGYGKFLFMLTYKLQDHGGELIKVDKWFPSSQLCNRCGSLHPEMRNLSLRILNCGCGYTCDRDYNAAKNIKKEGLRMFKLAS